MKFFQKGVDKGKSLWYNNRVENIGASPSGKATDSDSVITGVRIPVPQPKNTENFVLGIFLSKPQAWHIITARSAVHIISPFGAVSHHALACILLRLDDIQHFVLVIYNASHWWYPRLRRDLERISPQFLANALQSPRFYAILIAERRWNDEF